MSKIDRAFIRVYRETARLEQNNECQYCYEKLSYRKNTADHVKPRFKNGGNAKENIVACCGPCNSLKGHMSAAKYKSLIKSFPHGQSIQMLLTWSRRRINLCVKRAEKNIMVAVGRWVDIEPDNGKFKNNEQIQKKDKTNDRSIRVLDSAAQW